MGHLSEKPFASIESAQEFITLLFDTVAEAKRDVDADIVQNESKDSRRVDALRVASVHLNNLEHHVVRTRRILNDLRSLRRLLFEERVASAKIAKLEPAVQPPSALSQTRLPVSTVRAIRAMAKAAAAGD